MARLTADTEERLDIDYAGDPPAAAASRNRRLFALLLVVLGLAFILTRIVFLDADLPPWGLTHYQPIDELFYTISSFNLFHYGSWAHQVVPFVRDDSSPLNVLQGLMTWVGLELFGNTYEGLRIASELVSWCSFGLMAVLLWRIVPASDALGAPAGGIGRAAVAGLWTMVAFFDFSFLVSARVAEPTSFRLVAVCAILVLCSLPYFNATVRVRRTFLLGLLTGVAVAFVYVYNAFLVPGVFVAVLAWSWHGGRRETARHGAVFAIGAATAIAAYFGFVWWVYRVGPLTWYRRWVEQYSGRASRAGMHNLWAVGVGNIFRLNPGLLVVALASLPLFVYAVWRYRGRLDAAVLGVLAFFLAQTIFVNDFPQRKMLVLLPIVLAVIAAAHARMPEVLQRMPWARRTVVAAVVSGLALWVAFLSQGLAARLDVPGWVVRGGFKTGVTAMAVTVGVLLIVLPLATQRRPRVRLALDASLLVCLAAPGAFLGVKYIYAHPTYTYRDAMIAAAPQVNGRVTAGGLSYSMRLYNSSVPVLDPYNVPREALRSLDEAPGERALYRGVVRLHRVGRSAAGLRERGTFSCSGTTCPWRCRP